MEKQKLYISVDVDKEGMLGKIATAIKLEDELRDVLNEIKREIHLKEDSRMDHITKEVQRGKKQTLSRRQNNTKKVLPERSRQHFLQGLSLVQCFGVYCDFFNVVI